MKVVILAGGKGNRYNSDIPKPLAPIGNSPIIHHVMNTYQSQGYNDFIIALGYKKEKIIDYFNNIKHDFNITFVDTGEDSNTAHRIKMIEKLIPEEDDNFLCSYADGIANVDLELLIRQHEKLNSICTLTAVRPFHQYGILKIDFDGRIIQFIEKPRIKEYINGGFFIFKRSIFDHITQSNEDLEKQILPRLCYEGKLGAYKHEEYWDTINTVKDEIRINRIYDDFLADNKSPPWLMLHQKRLFYGIT